MRYIRQSVIVPTPTAFFGAFSLNPRLSSRISRLAPLLLLRPIEPLHFLWLGTFRTSIRSWSVPSVEGGLARPENTKHRASVQCRLLRILTKFRLLFSCGLKITQPNHVCQFRNLISTMMCVAVIFTARFHDCAWSRVPQTP